MEASDIQHGKQYWLKDHSYNGPVVVEENTRGADFFYCYPPDWMAPGVWPSKKFVCEFDPKAKVFKEYLDIQQEMAMAEQNYRQLTAKLDKKLEEFTQRLEESANQGEKDV